MEWRFSELVSNRYVFSKINIFLIEDNCNSVLTFPIHPVFQQQCRRSSPFLQTPAAAGPFPRPACPHWQTWGHGVIVGSAAASSFGDVPSGCPVWGISLQKVDVCLVQDGAWQGLDHSGSLSRLYFRLFDFSAADKMKQLEQTGWAVLPVNLETGLHGWGVLPCHEWSPGGSAS